MVACEGRVSLPYNLGITLVEYSLLIATNRIMTIYLTIKMITVNKALCLRRIAVVSNPINRKVIIITQNVAIFKIVQLLTLSLW